MINMNDNVQFLKGVGEKKAKALEKLGITTLRDLVSYFPRAYEDRRKIYAIDEAPLETPVCVRAMVGTSPLSVRVRGGMEILKFRAVDDRSALDISYFNQSYLKNNLHVGESYIFYGKISLLHGRRSMTNPEFEAENRQGVVTGRILPIYRLTAGIGRKSLTSLLENALAACGDRLPDVLPETVRERNRLAQARFAYQNIHFPESDGALELARKRLVFEELFVLAAALGLLRDRRSGDEGLRFSQKSLEPFWARLPFSPTNAQKRAAAEAVADMCSGRPMSRLLQGDVGSGKTLVAAALVWFCAQNGHQSAFMAPTEILAEQHYNTLSEMLSPYGLRCEKLTGSMSAKQKREAVARLTGGEAVLAVGTHALISDSVTFSSLGLVITDEQHRFGVQQRSALAEKGAKPHILVMSATPIPRTLALIIYGDLDISVLNELPPGRQKVDTFAVGEDMRDRIWNFVRRLVGEGRQVFIVCPMIEENEELPPNLKSAQSHAKLLDETVFPEFRIACIHGKMKPKEKDRLMGAFSRGEYDILVATTVIEVGVDIPNAALMIVENAERFGLSQLHQLRGRVGRGRHKSYCVLFSDAEGESAKTRLSAMCKTNDGFKISEEDLKLRGPGDFFGARQHGLPEMHIADLSADMRVLKLAQTEALELLKQDPTLQQPDHQKLRERISELFELHSESFN